jgi:hypothetical protein
MSDETFRTWLALVDAAVRARTGFGREDYPDQLYRDHFEMDVTPTEMAEIIIEGGI